MFAFVLGLLSVHVNARGEAETAADADDMLIIPEEGLLYGREYRIIGYSTSPPTGPVSRLARSLARGETALEFDPARGGYLASLLEALGIDTESQVLVYSKTSINAPLITAQNPRAIYFNDDTYVGWVPGAGEIEISAMEPELGPVFYNLVQQKDTPARFDRQGAQCLRCHDSYSLTGGGVPRFIMGSGYTYTTGNLVSHEGWILTSQETPLRFRWGGWYVTGTHGEQVHLGNIVVRDASELYDLESMRRGNITDLDGLFDTERYLTRHSDIVALMILEHQVHVQNLMTRVNYDVRAAIHGNATGAMPQGNTAEASFEDQVGEISEPLVKAMLMSGEAPLADRVRGTSGFTAGFEKRGPSDGRGRSLRQLDLETRLFRYPLSYLVYSAAFDRLPDPAKAYIYRRFAEILDGEDKSGDYDHLSGEDRAAIREILMETKPDFQAAIDP